MPLFVVIIKGTEETKVGTIPIPCVVHDDGEPSVILDEPIVKFFLTAGHHIRMTTLIFAAGDYPLSRQTRY